MTLRLTAEWNVDVKTTNLDSVVSNINSIRGKMRQAAKDAVGRSAARLQSRVIDICPKDTFYMSENVRADFSQSGLTYDVGWDARDFLGTLDEKHHPRSFYPFYVEFGTRKMRARYPLTRATREEEPLFYAELSRAIGRAAE